jgi:putative ABC transport system permease protein
LPISHLDRIRDVPGVKTVVPYAWYMGTYKDERAWFGLVGTIASDIFQVWDECEIDPTQLEAWKEDRQGCVVDRVTARRYGWAVGERIPMKGSNYDYDLDLRLRGIYDGPEWIQGMFFHFDYLDTGLRAKNSPMAGSAGFYFMKAQSAEVIPQVCEEIDRRFASSTAPTRSQSHQAFAQMFEKFLGNIQAYIRNIGFAVVVALTLVAGNTISMSMRERTTEIAVLKAIGFMKRQILGFVLGESIITAVFGGVVGVSIAQGLWMTMHHLYPQFLPYGVLAWAVMLYGILVAVAVGFISGVVPAVRAANLSVIDGLRRVA